MKSGNIYEAVVSVDLGWSPETITRTAVAFWRPGTDPQWTEPGIISVGDLLGILACFKDERTLILLDIPIYGTEGLSKSNPFRPLDRVLLSCGIALYPSYRAGSHGRELASHISEISSNFEVVESYPHPVHRFMWLAQSEPWCLDEALRPVAGLEYWKRSWPPKYKSGRLETRKATFAAFLDNLGKFLPGDFSSLYPQPETRAKELAVHGDIYDALVGLKVGIEMARSSPWVLEARVEYHDGMIPILADSNLRAIWESSLSRYVQSGIFASTPKPCI